MNKIFLVIINMFLFIPVVHSAPNDDARICAQLNGKTFFTSTLEEGGNSPDGPGFRRWSIQFGPNNNVSMHQSDFVIRGRISCVGGDVILTRFGEEDQVLSFSKFFEELTFNPLDGPDKTYILLGRGGCGDGKCSTSSAECATVRNRTYVSDSANFQRLEFGRSRVNVNENGVTTNRYFECDLDRLHIHRGPRDKSPLNLRVVNGGRSIKVAPPGSALQTLTEENTSRQNVCQYKVTNSWDTGFVAEVRLTNNSESPIDGWEVSWSYPDGSLIDNSWNAQLTESHDGYTAAQFHWNRIIAPGQSVVFGFQGSNGSSGKAETVNIVGDLCP